MARLEEYIQCAEEGLTLEEAARRLGVRPSAARRFASVNKVVFADMRKTNLMTPSQARDFRVLMEKGGYSEDEAVAIIQRPKVKMRAYKGDGG